MKTEKLIRLGAIVLCCSMITGALSGCSQKTAVATVTTAAADSTAAADAAGSADATGAAVDYKYGKLQIQALGGGACGAPSYIAYELGFFKEEGLDVELVSGTLDDLKAGLASGAFTVANGDFQFFPSIQQGLDLKVIGGLHKGCIKIVVPPDSDIKSVADLAGKRIGIDEPGGTPQAVASVALANAGIDPTTGVTWVTYSLDLLTEAVKKGEVDAFAAWDPYGALAAKNDGYTILTDIATDDLFAGKSCCLLYASGSQIEKDPERVAAIARAYKKACEWINANPLETAKIEINKGYVAADDVDFLAELIASYDYEYTTDEGKADVKYFVEQLNKTGFLAADTDPETFANDVYYDVFATGK